MKKILYYTFMAGSLIWISCNSNDQTKPTESKESKKELPLSSDNRKTEKISAADSAKVLTYEDLISKLPEIPGYEKVLAGGETLSAATSGGRLSYARQEYAGAKGKIIIDLSDYAIAEQGLHFLKNMYEENSKLQKPEISMTRKMIADKNGIQYTEIVTETGYKTVREIIADRFILNIAGNEKTSLQFLTDIAAKIKMQEKQ